jgi:hypothetical protein
LELNGEYASLVKEKLEKFHISPSSISNWLLCENKFFYYNICKIPGLPNVHTSFGQLVHTVLESIVSGVNLNPGASDISDIVDQLFLKYQHRFHPLHRFIYKRYAKEVVGLYLYNTPIIKKPVFVEKYLTTTLTNGVRLNGIVDRIDQTDTGYHVIDYKTNKYADKLEPFVDDNNTGNSFWKQGAIYHQLISNNFPEANTIDLSFDFVRLNRRVVFKKENNLEFDNWLLGLWSNIQTLNLNAKCTDQACVYCAKK